MPIARVVSAALLVPALSLSAQSIQGLIVDRVTQKKIPDVTVVLIDSSGGESAQTRSDSTGYFAVVAPASGVYHLRFLLTRVELSARLSIDKYAVNSPSITLAGDTLVQQVFALDLSSSPSRVYFEFEVDRQVAPIASLNGPKYPEQMRTQNIEGSVLVQFVVDTAGRVERGSFKVLRSTHPEFVEAVRTYLTVAKYRPAALNGRTVRQLVQQPFNFTLTY